MRAQGKAYLVANHEIIHKILWIERERFRLAQARHPRTIRLSLKTNGKMDQPHRITYIGGMSTAMPDGKVTLAQLGGWRGLLRNPGLFLFTLRRGLHAGTDELGNQFYERKVAGSSRTRRWVIYAGAADASVIGPEWHSWLHHLTDAPLPDTGRRSWQLPHLPNLTGTAASYRPPGHDYEGGKRARASADYESWSPDL